MLFKLFGFFLLLVALPFLFVAFMFILGFLRLALGFKKVQKQTYSSRNPFNFYKKDIGNKKTVTNLRMCDKCNSFFPESELKDTKNGWLCRQCQ